MRRSSFLFLIALIIGFSSVHCGTASAHPHVFVDCRLSLLVEGDTLKEISMEWEFDSIFSSFILEDYDLDHDGTLSSEELKAYEKILLEELPVVDFFSYCRTDGKIWPVQKVKALKVTYEDPSVFMKIDIPLGVTIGKKETIVGITVYDIEYYLSFRYGPDNEVSLRGGENLDIQYDIVDDPARAYYMGQVVPEEVVLYLKKR